MSKKEIRKHAFRYLKVHERYFLYFKLQRTSKEQSKNLPMPNTCVIQQPSKITGYGLTYMDSLHLMQICNSFLPRLQKETQMHL